MTRYISRGLEFKGVLLGIALGRKEFLSLVDLVWGTASHCLVALPPAGCWSKAQYPSGTPVGTTTCMIVDDDLVKEDQHTQTFPWHSLSWRVSKSRSPGVLWHWTSELHQVDILTWWLIRYTAECRWINTKTNLQNFRSMTLAESQTFRDKFLEV